MDSGVSLKVNMRWKKPTVKLKNFCKAHDAMHMIQKKHLRLKQGTYISLYS